MITRINNDRSLVDNNNVAGSGDTADDDDSDINDVKYNDVTSDNTVPKIRNIYSQK